MDSRIKRTIREPGERPRPPRPPRLGETVPQAIGHDQASDLEWLERYSPRWHGERQSNIERNYLIHEMLYEVGTALISGQTGTFKTAVAIALALACMIDGGTFAGRPVLRRGGVLYIAYEGADEVMIRLQAAYERLVPGGPPLPLVRLVGGPRLLDRKAEEDLGKILQHYATEMQEKFELPLVLTIADTIGVAAEYSDDNTTAEVRKVAAMFNRLSRKFKCLMTGIEHFGKDPEKGTAGSHAKEADVDTVLALLGDKDVSGLVANSRMVIRKMRGGETGLQFPFSVIKPELGKDQHGNTIRTVVIEWAKMNQGISASADPWPKKYRVLRDALVEALLTSGFDAAPFGDKVKVVADTDLRREFYRRYIVDGDTPEKRSDARRTAYKRALRDAQNNGLIGVRGDGDATIIWNATRQNVRPPKSELVDSAVLEDGI